MKPATVISKKRGDEPEIHYLIGPQRETREAAERDLWAWLRLEDQRGALTPEEEKAVACARVGASHEVDTLLAIIDRLSRGALTPNEMRRLAGFAPIEEPA